MNGLNNSSLQIKVNRKIIMDKKINFEYCVKRAEVLTEMARPVNLFGLMERELNNAYDFLRKHIQERTMESSGITSEKAIRMIIKYIKDTVQLSNDEIKSIEQTTRGGVQLGKMKMLIDKVVKDRRLDKRGLIEYITNPEKIDHFLDFTIMNQGNRAQGREKEIQKETDLTREELAELTRRMLPYAREIGKLMRQKAGLYDPDMGESDTEFNDKVVYADYIVDAIQKFLIKKNSLKEVEDYSDPRERSLFASKKEDNSIYSAVSERDINMFLNYFQKKVDSGEGETSEGFDEFINKLKSKGLSEKQSAFVNLIKNTADEDYRNFTEDMRDMNAQIAGLPYYDGELVRRVIKNPDDLQDFVLWNSAKDRLEANKAFKQGTSFKFDIPNETPVKESLDICSQILNEQMRRDKFQPEAPKFSERKFRKAPNAYYWLEENRRLFGE